MSEERLAEREEQQALERLPAWVPLYLAAWGSVRPDGKQMSVVWAAGHAGVTDSAVRSLRERSRQFRTLEYLARHGTAAFMTSYAEAGLRGSASLILKAYLELVDEGNAAAVLQGMKWLLGSPDQVVRQEGDQVVRFDLSGLDPESLRALAVGGEPGGAEGGGAA